MNEASHLVFCLSTFVIGTLFFLSYFYENNSILKYFVAFAIKTYLSKTDKRRVFIFAAMFWGMSLLAGFFYYAETWSP